MNITIDKCCFGVLVAAVIVCSCGKGHDKPDYEQQGQRWLALARSSLRDADYSLARVYVDSLRTRCKMALNAREDAIVLLDSINLAEAREQLAEAEFLAQQAGLDYIARDSFETRLDRVQAKVRFFDRKMQYDKAHKETHK